MNERLFDWFVTPGATNKMDQFAREAQNIYAPLLRRSEDIAPNFPATNKLFQPKIRCWWTDLPTTCRHTTHTSHTPPPTWQNKNPPPPQRLVIPN
jgi:hypothetical protein